MSDSEIAAKAARLEDENPEHDPSEDESTTDGPTSQEAADNGADTGLVDIRGRLYDVDKLLKSTVREADYRQTKQERDELRDTVASLTERMEDLLDQVEQREAAPAQEEEEYDDPLMARVAGLEKLVKPLVHKLQADSEAQAQSVQQEREMAQLNREIESLGGEPFYDKTAILDVMVERGLGLGQADIAYKFLAGEKRGFLAAETAIKKRGGDKPPVVPKSRTPGYGSPGSPETAPEPPRDWDEAAAAAANDPTRPGLR